MLPGDRFDLGSSAEPEAQQPSPAPSHWPPVLPGAALARCLNAQPGLSPGSQLDEAPFRVPGLVPSPDFAANSLYEPGQAPFPLYTTTMSGLVLKCAYPAILTFTKEMTKDLSKD